MVYKEHVGRTQVYLTQEELDLLSRARRKTGASRSEPIRRSVVAIYGHEEAPEHPEQHSDLVERALRAKYGPPERPVEERLAGLRAALGIWADRKFTGEEYVRAIRSGDMNENLRRLGV